MGVPFAKRGKRMDECIDVIRGLTSGDYFEYHGEFYDIPKFKMTPAPTKPVPILIGGHADAALRRAARNDGWMHGGGDPEELDPLLAKLQKFRDEEDRIGLADEFEIHVISIDGVHARRRQAARGQGRHRRHRRFPHPLHHGHGHRAARRQDPQPGVVRGERHREGVNSLAGNVVGGVRGRRDAAAVPRGLRRRSPRGTGRRSDGPAQPMRAATARALST